jgi:hypothetical protein
VVTNKTLKERPRTNAPILAMQERFQFSLPILQRA